MTNDRKAVSVDEACIYIGIKRTKFYELIAAESIETVKIGRRRLVLLDSLDRFISGLKPTDYEELLNANAM